MNKKRFSSKSLLSFSNFFLLCITYTIIILTPYKIVIPQCLNKTNPFLTQKDNNSGFLITNDDHTYSNEGWQLGVGFGLYIPGKESANFYNGSGKNSLRRVLFDYPYNYERIKEQFNHDFYLDSNNLPSAMKYNNTVILQFFSKYNFSENNGVMIDVGYAKLQTADFFTLIIDDPSNTTSDPTVELGKIWGIEERVSFNIGYIRTFGKPNKIKPFFELGININDTKVKDNKAQILNFTYSLLDPNDTYYGYKQGGIGFGYYGNAGVLFNLGDAFAAHVGGSFSLKRINLFPEPDYSKEWCFFIRLLYKNLFLREMPKSTTDFFLFWYK